MTADRLPERPHPEVGDLFTMPDGSEVVVNSWAQDHTGVRVNEVPVWDSPPPPLRGRAASTEQESSDG